MQSRSKRAAGLARRIASFLPLAGGCADSLGIFLIFFFVPASVWAGFINHF